MILTMGADLCLMLFFSKLHRHAHGMWFDFYSIRPKMEPWDHRTEPTRSWLGRVTHDSGFVKEPTHVARLQTGVGTFDVKKEISGLRWATRTTRL